MRVWSVSVVAILAAAPAWSFDGAEHYVLAEAALHRAASSAKSSREMIAAINRLNGGKWTFGDVTKAVDWFQSPDDLLLAESLDSALTARRRNYLKRGLAAHQNSAHFQKYALESWVRYHTKAISDAPSSPECALLEEAVALHYLQDFLAAGHVVTPRKHMHDAAAGSLHDFFNKRGVDFEFQLDAIDSDAALLFNGIGRDRKSGSNLARFHGDGELVDNTDQEVFVEAISTLSMLEVLRSSVGNADTANLLQTCFVPRKPRDTQGPFFYGPEGGVRLVTHGERIATSCEGDWLGRYLVKDDPALKFRDYEVEGLLVRGEVAFGRSTKHRRATTELMLLGGVSEPQASSTLTQFLTAFGVSVVRGNGYRAVGPQWELQYSEIFLPEGGVVGFRLGPRRYSFDNRSAFRLDGGISITVGFDVVAVSVGFEDGHSISSQGRFEREQFFTLSLQGTWTRAWSQYTGFLGPFIRLLTPHYHTNPRDPEAAPKSH